MAPNGRSEVSLAPRCRADRRTPRDVSVITVLPAPPRDAGAFGTGAYGPSASHASVTNLALCPSDGTIYFTDRVSNCVRAARPPADGTDSTAYTVSVFAGVPGTKGYRDGISSQALFGARASACAYYRSCAHAQRRPRASARRARLNTQPPTLTCAAPADDPVGIEYLPATCEVIVVDSGNHRVRAIDADGIVRTIAGDGAHGVRDGRGTLSASLSIPGFVKAGANGSLHVSQWDALCVREIDSAGMVWTPHASPLLGNVGGIALDQVGNVVVSNAARHTIVRCVTEGNRVRYEVVAGCADASGRSDGYGTAARFASPRGMALDGDGNLVIADSENHAIRVLSPSGEVSTLAGCGSAGNVDGPTRAAELGGDGRWLGPPLGALFNQPRDVAIGADGSVFVSDAGNNSIRKIVGACLARPLPPAAPLTSTHKADLLSMLEDSDLSDVTFDVGGTMVTAHRAILASRSTYFRAMFKGQFKEARCGTGGAQADAVCIGEIGASAFVELLRYLYTDDLSVFTEANLVEVLRKAREMELGRVAAHALSLCTAGLNEHNAAERLIAARRGGLTELDEAAFRFVTHHFKLVRDAAPEGLSALNEFDSKLFEAVVMQAVLT